MNLHAGPYSAATFTSFQDTPVVDEELQSISAPHVVHKVGVDEVRS